MQTKPIAGVNLGGWLVLEKWITPALFADTSTTDEYTFCQQADAAGLARLKHFRETFITKQDFAWLAAHGITAVRLPVGYWLFDVAPYAPTVQYVDKAFEWAAETGLRILLDLHGAPGSQNGRDHSGQAGSAGWETRAGQLQTEALATIEQLARRYGRHPALLGIELLNEPSRRVPKAELLGYYQKAYGIIRGYCGDDVWVVYSDGFAPGVWRKALPKSNFTNVYIDMHHYQVFSPTDKSASPRWSLLHTRLRLPRALARLRKYHPVIVGEWSLTLGSRKLHSLSAQKRREITAAYAAAQLQAYQKTAAWFFWTYKTEHGGTWSFRDCVDDITGGHEKP